MRRALATLTAAAALVVIPATTAHAETYGWKWAEVVDVYDGTGTGNNWKVAEAVAEWDATSGIQMRMTSDPAAANIVVNEVSSACNGHPGCAYFPPSSNGIAYGTCTVELTSAYRTWGVAEHVALHEIGHCLGLDHTNNNRALMRATVSTGDYFTKPQPFDRREMRSLYGR